ncbi:Coiled-coil domain-containing protein 135 [Gryllus bimaculatus]|nr:Coiled-coil domain-containing protein 135 [Gryllus bimaculatus]
MAEEEQNAEQITEDPDKPSSTDNETLKKSILEDEKPDDRQSGTVLEKDDIFELFDFDTPKSGAEIFEDPEDDDDSQETGPRKITPKLLKNIANELGLIHLCWPLQAPEDAKKFPPSYYENNSKEKLILLYAENFRQQFHFIFPDRKPLLLAADNECGLQKMVCTTIRPTRLPYPELSNWEGCAHFVADHLVYVPLHKPTRIWQAVTLGSEQHSSQRRNFSPCVTASAAVAGGSSSSSSSDSSNFFGQGAHVVIVLRIQQHTVERGPHLTGGQAAARVPVHLLQPAGGQRQNQPVPSPFPLLSLSPVTAAATAAAGSSSCVAATAAAAGNPATCCCCCLSQYQRASSSSGCAVERGVWAAANAGATAADAGCWCASTVLGLPSSSPIRSRFRSEGPLLSRSTLRSFSPSDCCDSGEPHERATLRSLSSLLHQPRSVDSGTPMSLATDALDSPLCTRRIASSFSCTDNCRMGRLAGSMVSAAMHRRTGAHGPTPHARSHAHARSRGHARSAKTIERAGGENKSRKVSERSSCAKVRATSSSSAQSTRNRFGNFCLCLVCKRDDTRKEKHSASQSSDSLRTVRVDGPLHDDGQFGHCLAGRKDKRKEREEPVKIMSPTSVLQRQQGNCFECSTVLCSFLTGIGYDAYVVSGYATKALCRADQSNIDNPELKKYKPVIVPPPPPAPRKYEMKLTKEFDSQYLKAMQERADLEAKLKEEEKEAEDNMKQILTERVAELPTDELFGVRVHSWVLIRPGTLGIEEAFFIDPPTGRSFSPVDANFLGLESLWNNTNYWVNMQDCSEGCRNLKFDLKDPTCWNWLLMAEPWYMRSQADEDREREEEEEDEEKADPERKELAKYLIEKHLDMPASWVARLEIPEAVYRRRYPGGHKEVVDYYAPYVKNDGLTMYIVSFSDKNYKVKEMVYETYQNRSDLLTDVIKNFETNLVTEKYSRGREEGLKEHQYYMGHTAVEDKRKLNFFYEARADGLSELIMDPLFLTLHYIDRIDFLYYRHAIFEPRLEGEISEDKRNVLSLIEKFHKNPDKNNEEDIAERTYIPPENRIFLKFHYGDTKVIASTREFIKPPPEKLGDKLQFENEMTVGFNVDPTYPNLKSYELFELLKEQLLAEEQAFFELRALEDELSLLLKLRIAEIEVPKLAVSIYDTERNKEAKGEMLDKDQKIKEQIVKEHEAEVDYLAPYLAFLGLTHTKSLSLKDATTVRDMCLNDHKNIFVNRANNMQEAFERTCNTLRMKHYWYEQQRDNLTKEEEEEYFEQCNQLRFYLHTLEIRLKRHRDLVPQKYAALEAWLEKDPRLACLYKKK